MRPIKSGITPTDYHPGFRSGLPFLWLLIVSVAMFSLSIIVSPDANANEQKQKAMTQEFDTTSHQSKRPLKSRWKPAKPEKTILKPWHDRNRVVVKFAEGSEIRLRPGGLTSLKGQNLGEVRAVLARHRVNANKLGRYFTRPEESLDRDKRNGEARSGRQLANLNLYFHISVADGIDAGLLCDDLNALDIVELAEPSPVSAPLPVDLDPPTGDYSSDQGYLGPAPGGIGVNNLQHISGIDGTGMAFVDIEYNWTLDHEDLELPPSTNIDSKTLADPHPGDINKNHGTAVLGVIVGGDNGYGVTGIAPAATAYVAPAETESELEPGESLYNVGRAVSLATAALDAGDVVLIEQQIAVCGAAACVNSLMGCGPVEWYDPWYDAIATATANGIIVVETAGNGNVNLDDPACNSKFDPSVRDSGAIIVGAGDATTHAKLGLSTYGRRVDLQGWGASVTTTGYNGILFDPGDIRQRYTSNFGGTSGAGAIVTGAILSIQGALKAAVQNPLIPEQMRQLLIDTGTPQPDNLHIGPLPDVGAALLDSDGDGLIDHIENTVLGTNPNNVDTDNDGLVDGAGGMVPLSALPWGSDVDSDGFVDGERDFGTDPTNDDSDDDSIPDGLDMLAGRNPLVANWAVSAGGYHTCALDDSGVACWGNDSYNQATEPTMNNPVTISAGTYHTCALDDSGVVCWGRNFEGQATEPTLSNPVAVSAGGYHSCALDDSGVACWGRNSEGQVTEPTLSNPVSVSAGGYHTCALDDSGVACWGDNTYGQATEPTLSNPVSVSAGYWHTCALDDSGVVCWGRNVEGQTTEPTLSNPVAVSAGYNHSCSLDDSGVDCWGDNTYGQSWSPILPLNNPAAISAGTLHTCALDDSGVVCWGYPGGGRTAVPMLAFDKDLDGVLDSVEDANGNGVVDAGETDPLNPDTDGDGFTDGDEIAAGSDPLDINSVPFVVELGDLNADGSVDAADILIATRIIEGSIVPSTEQFEAMDVAPLVGNVPSPDGQLNAGDLLLIQRKALGLASF